VNAFRGTLETVVALAVLVPIVTAIADDAATQTLAVIVRAIQLGEISWERGVGDGPNLEDDCVQLERGCSIENRDELRLLLRDRQPGT